MKKILHVSKFYYPYYGGIEDVAHTIIMELNSYYEQRVICFNHERGGVYNVNGVDVLRVNVPIVLFSQPISIAYRKILKKQIDEFRPDYIHLHLPNPLVATYLLSMDLHGAKLISHWHSDILGQKFVYPFYRRLEKKILQISDKIIATSELYASASASLKEYLEKIIVLPNTVNENKLCLYEGERVKVEEIKKSYKGKKIVLFVGRHVAYKGIEYLIQAEKYLDDDAVILIAGTGELSKDLKGLAVNCKRIKFVGRLSNNDLKYYLYAATVFAFPSITRQEAFGVALAEALYCGLPAVSFYIEGSGAIWVSKDRYTGIVVKDRNAKSYAEGLNCLLRNENLRNEYARNAKEWVNENFLKGQIVNKMKLIYS